MKNVITAVSLVVALFAAFFFGFSQKVVVAEVSDVTFIVSNIKGSPGDIARIPIYVSELPIGVQEVSMDIKYPSILKFINIDTYNSPIAYNSGGGPDDVPRAHRLNLKLNGLSTEFREGRFVDLLFEVDGPKGSTGEIKLTNVSLGGEDLESLVLGGTFYVLPTVLYLPDRDLLEITSAEVFTTFVVEYYGNLGFVEAQEGDWVISDSDGQLKGSFASDQGVTSISLPVAEDSPLKIFSIRFEGETIILQRRETFLPTLNTGN